MDPISQGAVGAAFAQSAADRDKLKAYGIFGALAGMAPDLDVFIQSSTDPLLFLEYHRHFTHALIFIPVGALIVAAVLFRIWRHPLTFRQAYLAALIGYGTHGLLDACTSYGTQLFWPFSDVRIAWNNVSVVDPFFTVPLLVLVILSVKRGSRQLAIASLVWIVSYLTFGVVQHDRALSVAHAEAIERGHTPARLTVKPGFGNLIVWKSIYEHDGYYYVDGVRVLVENSFCVGDRIEKYNATKHLPQLDPSSQQALDIERFRWFSDDYMAPFDEPGAIIDVRYAAVPNEINPLWGIQIDTTAGIAAHADFVPRRRANAEQTQALWGLISGRSCSARL